MATSVAPYLDVRGSNWPPSPHTSAFDPASSGPGLFTLGPMPRSPPTRETLGGSSSSTTRLPSISNFLAVADSRSNFDLAPLGSAPHPGEVRPPLTPSIPLQLGNSSLGHHVHQPSAYNTSVPPRLPQTDHVTQYPRTHTLPQQPAFWSHSSSQFRDNHYLSHHGPSSPPDSNSGRHHVAEQEIPGKGLCYVYQDGSVFPKMTGRETVNPKWGTTKAGKPRKRLGQACNTCREKKIKCDPSVPKCAQCQKFGRECKFESL